MRIVQILEHELIAEERCALERIALRTSSTRSGASGERETMRPRGAAFVVSR